MFAHGASNKDLIVHCILSTTRPAVSVMPDGHYWPHALNLPSSHITSVESSQRQFEREVKFCLSLYF